MQPKYWVQHSQLLLFHMICLEMQVSMLSEDKGLPYPDNELPNKKWNFHMLLLQHFGFNLVL